MAQTSARHLSKRSHWLAGSPRQLACQAGWPASCHGRWLCRLAKPGSEWHWPLADQLAKHGFPRRKYWFPKLKIKKTSNIWIFWLFDFLDFWPPSRPGAQKLKKSKSQQVRKSTDFEFFLFFLKSVFSPWETMLSQLVGQLAGSIC